MQRRGAAYGLVAVVVLALVVLVAVLAIGPFRDVLYPADDGDDQDAVDATTGAPALAAAFRRLRAADPVAIVARVDTPEGTWRSATGLRSVEPRRRADVDSSFRAGSLTKEAMAVMAMQLVERGTWTLETTVDDVAPGALPGHGDVTLGQLLSHRSGAPDVIAALTAKATTKQEFLALIARRWTPEELIGEVADLPWAFAPGTDTAYSNTDYLVVGQMLLAETGTPLPRLLQRKVLDPAGMSDSYLATEPGLPGDALQEYVTFDGEQLDLGGFDPTFAGSAGAMVSTAEDLDRFQSALFGGTLLEPRLVRTMEQVSNPESYIGLGLGLYRRDDPCRPGTFVYGHDGGTAGTMTRSYATEDGSRVVTVTVTGAAEGDKDMADALDRFLAGALRATCPAP